MIKLHPDNNYFWENCKDKKLLFQKCSNCNKVRWPYSIVCPECYSFNYDYIESKGFGKIYSYVIYNVAFSDEFKDKIPYIVAIIQLKEGVKFLSNIINSNINEIKCDKPVKLVWEPYKEFYIPKFEII